MTTKDKLIKTTIDIIAKEGLQSASAGNISKKSNFNKSLIFYYFDNLDDLLLSALNKSIEKISPIFKSDFENYSSLEDYLNLSVERLIKDRDNILYLRVILSFAHQSMYFKNFLDKLYRILFDDIKEVLIEAINFYKDRPISDDNLNTLASLVMASFNGLGIVLLADGSNDRFVKNWKLQVELISHYICKQKES